ncbi:MAG: hypothetical protein QOI24_1714 [Acidobacteriota bacterium]|jgi:hypothetical protein|nr:hypothetical protein [Acidobacteriota bacterium]
MIAIDEATAVIVCAGPSLESLSARAWQQLANAGAIAGVNGAPAADACVANGVKFTLLAAMDVHRGLFTRVPRLEKIWNTTSAWRVTSVDGPDIPADSYLVEVDEVDGGVYGWSDDPNEGYKGGSTAMVIGNWLGNPWPDGDVASRHPRGFRTLAYVGLDMHRDDGRHAPGAGQHSSGFADSSDRYARICRSWRLLCDEAARRGIRVVNLTPGTALAEMPYVEVPDEWLVPLEVAR